MTTPHEDEAGQAAGRVPIEALRLLVAEQCRVIFAMAKTLSDVHQDYVDIVRSGAMDDALQQIGERTARLMESLGDTMNDMDIADETDDWMAVIFEEAHRRFPAAALRSQDKGGEPAALAAEKVVAKYSGCRFGAFRDDGSFECVPERYEDAIEHPLFNRNPRWVGGYHDAHVVRAALIDFLAIASPAPALKPAETALRSALGAMLTQFGMDEDEWNKPTFNQARAALEVPAGSANATRDDAFEAVRRVFCKLPRYSFLLGNDGGVHRVADRYGRWLDFQSVHELFDPVVVDSALAKMLNAAPPADKGTQP